MNILIGGTGFIGSALSKDLLRRGESVISLSRSGKGSVPGVKYHKFDITADYITPNLLNRAKYAFILTGQISGGFNRKVELSAHTRLLKDLASTTPHIFLASTILIYGECTTPADENTPPNPIEDYEKFKLDCEEAAKKFIPANQLTIFRIATLYGPTKHNGFIVKATSSSKAEPLLLYGRGKIERDFLFIEDAASAMLAVRDRRGSSGIVNIASGESFSLLNIVTRLERLIGRRIPYKIKEKRGTGPHIIRISNRKLRSRFSFNSFTSIEDGLRKTIYK